MRCHLKLTALKTGHNKKLIARRLAADLATEIHRAEAMLDHLPVDIIKHAPEEKVKLVSVDYERLGCIVTITKEEEPQQLKPQPQPSPTVVMQPPVVQSAIKIDEVKPLRLSSFNNVKKVRPISLLRLDGVKLLLLITILIGALFFITRCPTVKKCFSSNTGKKESALPITTTAAVAQYSDSSIAEMEEQLAQVEDEEIKQTVKDTLAFAYSEKADANPDPGNRIKFYKAAISLNENNQAAWEGLVEALLEQGLTVEAEEAINKKERLFLEVDVMIEQIMNSMGPVVGESTSRRNILTFTYKTNLNNDWEIHNEMQKLHNAIMLVRKYRQISITARYGQKNLTASWINGKIVEK
jgi:hypothetical protein